MDRWGGGPLLSLLRPPTHSALLSSCFLTLSSIALTLHYDTTSEAALAIDALRSPSDVTTSPARHRSLDESFDCS